MFTTHRLSLVSNSTSEAIAAPTTPPISDTWSTAQEILSQTPHKRVFREIYQLRNPLRGWNPVYPKHKIALVFSTRQIKNSFTLAKPGPIAKARYSNDLRVTRLAGPQITHS